MKIKFFDSAKKNLLILSVLALSICAVFALSSIALGKYTIVFFYADWNLNSREAKPVIESVSSTYNNAKLVEINIDQPGAPAQARDLGLTLPRSIPHIYILESNNRIVNEFTYSGETPQQLKAKLDTYVLK
jgi:thiol-disulfide isomerase/thioredoxin